MLLDFLITVVKAVFVIFVALQLVPLLIYLERKISAYIQGRIGPNRVNFMVGHLRYLLPESLRSAIPEGLARVKLIPGSLQPLADAIKLATKEEIIPANADKVLWHLGPVLAFLPIGAAMAFIPFGGVFEFGPGSVLGMEVGHHVVDLRVAEANVGILGILAVGSLGVYGIACGGWGSGSKFPLMGAVRAAAQMISYEVALGLGLIAAIATAGTIDGQEFVRHQATTWMFNPDLVFGDFKLFAGDLSAGWLVFKQPLAALICLVAIFAENNRLPFDLPEAEPELVGGYHTEYTGLKFGVFFLGEYCAMILMCGLFVTVFLGGWSLPWSELHVLGFTLPGIDPNGTGVLNALASVAVFGLKLFLLLLLQVWIRWTLPRFRYDQLMTLGWKVLVPLALGNLIVTAVFVTTDNLLARACVPKPEAA
jgi:NADH-quinone oxidoreductase subunit H